MPRLTLSVAKTATITVGTSAKPTKAEVSRMCSREPAERRRRAMMSRPTCQPIMPSSPIR